MDIYFLGVLELPSNLLIAMNAKQWRCAQITKCLRNQVAMHKGVRVWRSSMAGQLPAEGSTKLAISHSEGQYPCIVVLLIQQI